MKQKFPAGAHAVRCAISAALVLCPISALPDSPAVRPALMLANVHERQTIDISEYWASEKYDGIRAYWNGTSLITRAGHPINTPDWFVRGWPSEPMDGELWIGRGRFEDVMAAVRDSVPNDVAWREVRYMVFDLPSYRGTFSERLAALNALLPIPENASIEAVRHWRIQDEQTLEQELNAIVAGGAEGLMLHKASSFYLADRSDDLLKVKAHRDAEAQVVAHVPGQGKYVGMLGALEVRTPNGATFRVGTGFTDAQRTHPPAIGTWITYRYHGATAKGLPRFATFVRERDRHEVTRATDEDAESAARR